jgi:diguanylate cyclase (GGDEF)-like protein
MVLAAVGHALAHVVRASDCPARWGGEEFVVALPSTQIEGGLVAAEKLRSALESLLIVSPSGDAIPITASFGVAVCRSGDTIDALIDRADRAMYAAKSGGRNRVVREAPTEEALPDGDRGHASAHSPL